MKSTIIKTTALTIVSFLFASFTFANPSDFLDKGKKKTKGSKAVKSTLNYVAYEVKDQNTLRINFEKEDNFTVLLKVYNEDNQLLFTDKVNRNEGKLAYNFDDLEPGNYTVKIISADFESTEKVTVKKKAVKPFSAYIESGVADEGKVKVICSNPSETVYLTITDKEGTIVYNDPYYYEATFGRIINVADLSAGSYTVTVSHGEASFTKEIIVE